ncbi:MAG: hypothetical protein CL581_10910 [Alteromonadaceae bacterium]|nr:hypothetical protein [Alteromonadaceae bacterium]|tara:strand:+ start:5335 stop:5577 length:243 start_codon:yes stop_codon:yes gene_type:complete
MSNDIDKLLGDLHSLLTKELLVKLESGDYCPADLNVARQFLKDNSISSADLTNKGSGLQKLADLVPFNDSNEPIKKASGE